MMRGESGFTLVEVLVATFVMALLAVIGSGLVSSVMTNRDRVEATGAQVRDLELARAVLQRDLSQIAPVLPRDAFGLSENFVFEAGQRFNEGRLMAFVTSGREMIGPRADNSRLEYVELIVEDGALIRRGWGFAHRTPESTPIDRVLLEDVTGLDVRFFTARGWVGMSGDRIAGGGQLPLATEISLLHPVFGELEMRFLINGGA